MELNDLMELVMYKAYQGMNVSEGESTSASSSEPWKPDNVEEAFAAIKNLVQQQQDGLTDTKSKKLQEDL